MRFYHSFLVAAAIIAVSGAARADNTSIKMLPPSDFSGNVCAGAKVGVLQWDGTNPIQCIPGFTGDKNGYVGIKTASPANFLQIGSVGKSQYGGNSLAIGDGTHVIAIDPYISGAATFYTNTNFAFMPSGVGSVGNVGIGTTNPKVKLDVGGEIRAGNSSVACSVENAGAIRFDSATKTFKGCDGTQWASLGKGTLKTQQVYCVGAYEGQFNDYGCKATCPSGTQVTGGGFQWGSVVSEWGRNLWQDGNGYHCLVNIQQCSSGAPSCGAGCYATCASIE